MTGAAFLCSRSADYGQDDEAREATTRRSDKLFSHNGLQSAAPELCNVRWGRIRPSSSNDQISETGHDPLSSSPHIRDRCEGLSPGLKPLPNIRGSLATESTLGY